MDRDKSGAIDFDEFLVGIRVYLFIMTLGLTQSNT